MRNEASTILLYQFVLSVVTLCISCAILFLRPERSSDAQVSTAIVLAYWFGRSARNGNGNGGENK